METSIFNLLSDLVKTGAITDGSLTLISIGLIGVLYMYVLKPMFVLIKEIPSKKDVEALITKDAVKLDVKELESKLDKIVESLQDVQDIDKDIHKDIVDLKRDVEHIKQILNQFQGHLLYGRTRSSDFGNKELK